MALHCYVIPQAVAARASHALRRVVHHAGVGQRAAVRPPAAVTPRPPVLRAPSDACSAPVQALRAMQRLAGLPAAGLVAGGLALGTAGAAATAGPGGWFGGTAVPWYGGGGGGFGAVASVPAAGQPATPDVTASSNPSAMQAEAPAAATPGAPLVTAASPNPANPVVTARRMRADRVEVPEPSGVAVAGFAAVLAAAWLARRSGRA